MTELPDDELDKLFRKSSEEFDPSYEPADWDALSRRLDEHDGKSPLGWLRKWWPLGLLSLLIPIGLGYYWLKSPVSDLNHFANTGKKYLTVKANEVEIPESKSRSATSAEKITETGLIPDELPTVSETSLAKRARNRAKNDVPVYTNRYRKSDVGSPRNLVRKSDKMTSGPFRKEAGYFESGRLKNEAGEGISSPLESGREAAGSKTLSGSRQTSTDVQGSQETIIPEVAEMKQGRSSADGVDFINPLPFTKNEGLALPDIDSPETVPPLEREKQRDISPKMAIRFGYSPDLTTVGLKNFSKPGSAVSMMIEYALLRKLYLQAGVVRSVKDYSAGAGEYKLNKYVTNINTPYGVDGTCTMIEIPLGFRYDLVQNERSRIFAGAGFASYYVQKEKYDYKYSDYVHGQVPGWKGKTGWFWLSHSTLSAGYEHRISNKLSLLAEPYIRIPLKGVGYGKVNLVTTGMWLSLRYTPVFNK